jgi:hypothetical protein
MFLLDDGVLASLCTLPFLVALQCRGGGRLLLRVWAQWPIVKAMRRSFIEADA